jgi:hypothetical protein
VDSPLAGHVIYGNTAAQNGGGFYNASGSPSLKQRVLFQHAATSGGGPRGEWLGVYCLRQ